MEIGIIILAGGKSSRMGEDKGLMPLFGKPMIEYVLDISKQISSEIIIVSPNINYSKFGFAVVKDKFYEKGPLAGIHAGLLKSKFDYNLVLSCDVPYVKEDLLQHLISQSENFDITISKHEDRIHPLIGVYRKKCILHFEKRIEANLLKMLDAIKELNVNIVDTEEYDSILFKNINSKKDISKN